MKTRLFHATVVFLLTFVFSTLSVYAQDENILIEPPLTWSINSIQIVWEVTQGKNTTQQTKIIFDSGAISTGHNPLENYGLIGTKVNTAVYVDGRFNYNQTNRTTNSNQWTESEKNVVSQALTAAFSQSSYQTFSNQRLVFTIDFINHTSSRLYFSSNSANTFKVYCGNVHIGDAHLKSNNTSIAATGKPIPFQFEMTLNNVGKQSLVNNRPIIHIDSEHLLIQSSPNVSKPVDDAIQESTISTGYFTVAILSGNEVREWQIRLIRNNPVTLLDALKAINDSVYDLNNDDSKTVFDIENKQLVSVCESLLSKKDDPDWITEIRVIKGSSTQTVSVLDLSQTPGRGERYIFQLINQEIIKPLKAKGNSGDIEALYELSERYGEGNGIPQNTTEAVKWLRKAAEQGHVKAQYNLVSCYLEGIGVEKNFEEAVKWLRKAAEQGDAEAQGILGLFYYLGVGVPQNVNEAIKWFHKATEQDNSIGLMGLACCYECGEGVTKDKKEALKWINKFFELLKRPNDKHNSWYSKDDKIEEIINAIAKAANQERILAQVYYGNFIIESNDVPEEKAKGVKWLLKAAEQGNTFAQISLGIIYSSNDVVPQDMTEAIKWLRKAAEQGVVFAQLILGSFYQEGIGIPADKTEAVKWYRMAAEQGNAKAQDMLGNYYLIGIGVPQDYSEAVKWYRMAAEQGYADSQTTLGLCYVNGKGVPEDIAEGVKWYRKAAEQGDARGQQYLGRCYYIGNGVPQSYSEAVKWYRKAAEQGYSAAQIHLGFCYYSGDGVPQSYSEAANWFRKSAEQGYAEGQYELGYCYAYGKGVKRDLTNAKYWLRKAADQGDKKAIDLLKRVNSWWW